MQETELDLSDDSDYAASQLHGSVYMSQSDSVNTISSTEPEGAEIVYAKDNVTIHPSQFATERISVRLKLIKQGPSLIMRTLSSLELSKGCFCCTCATVNRIGIRCSVTCK